MPSSLDAHPRNSALRRVQSTGDIPREPRPIYRPHESCQSARHSNVHDDAEQAGRTSSSSASSPNPHLLPVIQALQSQTTQPLERVQTQMSSGPVAPQEVQAPTRQQPRSLYRRSMTFLGLGGASPERRSLMGLLFNLVSGFSQVCSIIHD
jgi:hypothetical protein